MKTNRRKGQSKTWDAKRAAPWVLGMFIAIGLSGAWYFYKQKDAAAQRAAFSAYLAEAKDWMSSRRARLKSEMTAIKTEATVKEADKIHFEFYTSLGKMQVGLSAPKPTVLPDKPKAKLFVSQASDLEKDVLATLQARNN
jgi:hypothetical protein